MFQDKPRKKTGFYSVSLLNGQIILRISSGPDQSEVNLSSNETYNDGLPHIVTVAKTAFR